MSILTKAIARASFSIASGALFTGFAVIIAESTHVSKLSAGLLSIGMFFIGSILGSMLDEWLRKRKHQNASDQQLIASLDNLIESIPDAAAQKMNKQVNDLSMSVQRMKAQLAIKGIKYVPPDRPFKAPTTERERNEALRMCKNAKKLLDFAISMNDSEETINSLTAEVDHWLNVLNQSSQSTAGPIQGQA